MSIFSTDALRDTLAASYDDPERPPEPDFPTMLDDILRRIAELNAQAHINAFERTMDGKTEGFGLTSVMNPMSMNMDNAKRVLRSRIGRGVAKIGIKAALPEVPGVVIDKGVDIAGHLAKKEKKK